MRKVVVEVGEDGRIIAPPGVRLRISAEVVEPPEKQGEVPQDKPQLQALWDKINADADEVVLKPWPEGDPIVEKYRRKGLID